MAADQQEYVDIESALARVRGNKTLYRRMLGLFLQSAEFDRFEAALSQKDYSQAADAAHGIKGMTGNLAMNLLFATSTELVQQLRQGPPDEDTLARYRAALSGTRAVVEDLAAKLDAGAL